MSEPTAHGPCWRPGCGHRWLGHPGPHGSERCLAAGCGCRDYVDPARVYAMTLCLRCTHPIVDSRREDGRLTDSDFRDYAKLHQVPVCACEVAGMLTSQTARELIRKTLVGAEWSDRLLALSPMILDRLEPALVRQLLDWARHRSVFRDTWHAPAQLVSRCERALANPKGNRDRSIAKEVSALSEITKDAGPDWDPPAGPRPVPDPDATPVIGTPLPNLAGPGGTLIDPGPVKLVPFNKTESAWGKCHWCGKELEGHTWHHTSAKRRACCRSCYNSPTSNYRLVYGPDADGEQEDREAAKAAPLCETCGRPAIMGPGFRARALSLGIERCSCKPAK